MEAFQLNDTVSPLSSIVSVLESEKPIPALLEEALQKLSAQRNVVDSLILHESNFVNWWHEIKWKLESLRMKMSAEPFYGSNELTEATVDSSWIDLKEKCEDYRKLVRPSL